MKPIKYCPKCGHIDITDGFKECIFCQTSYKNTKYDANHCLENGKLIPEVEKEIMDEYILESPELSQEAIAERLDQKRYTKGNSSTNENYKNSDDIIYKMYTEMLEIKLNQIKSLQQFNYIKSINAKLTFFVILTIINIITSIILALR